MTSAVYSNSVMIVRTINCQSPAYIQRPLMYRAVVWRCVYSFHVWGVTLYTLQWGEGDLRSVDVFAQHSHCWIQTVLAHFLFCGPSN